MTKYIAIIDNVCSEAQDTPKDAVSQLLYVAKINPDEYGDIVITMVTPLKVKLDGFSIVNDG